MKRVFEAEIVIFADTTQAICRMLPLRSARRDQLIRITDARHVADELHGRYEPIRAVTLIARILQKALFGGRSDDVVFWAIVYAHYRGGTLSGRTEAELEAFREFILPDQ